MVILGLILIVLGLFLAGAKWLLIVGSVVLILGLILNMVPVGGTRRRYY
jgi:hypothetical protein